MKKYVLILLCLMSFSGLMAQTYNNVTHFSGTTTIAGVGVTVTSAGGGVYGGCTYASPYYVGNSGTTSFTWSFSTPVSSIRSHIDAQNVGDNIRITINGSAYSVSAGQLTPLPAYCFGSGCTTPSVASGGAIINTNCGGATLTITPGFGINSIKIEGDASGNGSTLNFAFGGEVVNATPSFTGGSAQSLSVCQNSTANSINSLLSVSDADAGNTLTWSVVSGPTNGSVGTGGTMSSTGGTVTPSGFTYSPTTGYTGTDAFYVRISDGAGGSDTIQINVTTNALPVVSGTSSVCVGNTVTLSSSASGGSWISGNTSIATVNSSGDVTGVAAGTCAISYFAAGCTGTMVVTVNASPVVSGPSSVCSGSTISLTSTIGGGSWTSGNTSIATVSTSGVVSGVASGSVTITYMVGGCMGTKSITVNNTPTITSETSSVCVGNTITLSASIGGGSWFSGSTGVATVVSGVVTGVSAGTALISYYVSGCLSTTTVTVNAIPTITTEESVYICSGSTYTLTASPSGGTWGSSDVAAATVGMTSGIVTGVATGSTSISYTVAGCASSSFHVGVLPGTEAPSSIEGPSSVCVGSSIFLSSSTESGSWSSSNPSVATVDGGMVSGVSGGTAAITYSVAGDCGTAYDVHIVTIISLPAAISGPSSVCVGSTITLASSPAGGTWSTGGDAVSVDASTGVVTGVTAGTATVTYTAPSGCSVVANITVDELPASITGTTSVCVGSTTTLSSATTGGSWTSSNTTRATVDAGTGVVSGVATGTVSISYTLSSGCRRKTTVTVIATPSSITGSFSLCSGSTTTLSSATTGGSWSSSNEAAATIDASTGLVTGVGTGTTTIMYTAGGCSVSAVVTVSGTVSANTGNALICIGQSSTLSNVTGGGTWSSSNASVATVSASTGLVTAVSAGVANITYTASAGCFAITEVTINAAVSDITGTTSVCPGLTTTLSNATSGGSWSSSNETRATVDAGTGVVTGVSGGTVTISYIVSAGCSKSTVVTVLSSPGAITGTASVCVGVTTTLSSSPGGGTWSISGSEATIGTTGIVTGVSAGTATVSYQNAAGCVTTRVVTVTAFAGAIGGTLSTCVGTTTTLTAAGGGTWSSANTLRATIGSATGIATGVSAGTVIITYAISSSCVSTAVLTVNTPASITGTALICAICTSTLTATPGGGTWTSSNAAAATIGLSSGIVSGVGAGTTTISYLVGGCRSTRIVTVNPSTSPSFGTPVVCVGQTNSTLSNPVPGGTWSSSNTSIATVHAANGVLTGVGVGNANITYTTSPGVYTIIVASVGALVANNVGTTSICPGTTTLLTNATAGGTWLSTNTAKATVGNTTGIVTGVTAGTASISYEINVGCYRVSTINIGTPPNVTGTQNVRLGFTRVFGGSPGGGTWSSANPAIASVTTGGVITGVSLGGTTISYTSAFAPGCTGTRTINVVPAKPGSPVVNEVETPKVLTVYPNPTSGSLTIDAPVGGVFTVYTIDGKEVAQYSVTASANMVTLPYGIAAGVYMCRFIGTDGTSTVVRLVYEQK